MDCKTKNCGSEATCDFDTEKMSAYCKCNNAEQKFDEEDKKCKRVCNDNKDCHNGGKCKISENGSLKSCQCLRGTDGPFCNIIIDCKTKNCGSKATCDFDTEKMSAYCKCNNAEQKFDEEDKKCKHVCNDNNDCHNGANCKISENGSLKSCQCLKGTDGPFCTNIIDCQTKNCGLEATCEFDTKNQSAYCKCNIAEEEFDEEDKKCKRPTTTAKPMTTAEPTIKDACDNETNPCKNGGICQESQGQKLCNCKKGTEGLLCEIVKDCENNSTFCGDEQTSGAKCAFDQKESKAVCKCNDNNLRFDERFLKCKNACDNKTNPCKNGGICQESKGQNLCNCKEGTEGLLCEIVKACENNSTFCGDEQISGAKCAFDQKETKAACECNNNNLRFDEKFLKCKNTCDRSNNTCDNGAECETRDNHNFCTCKKGTSGDFCQTIDECQQLQCNSDETTCSYDQEVEAAFCKCDDNSTAYDRKEKKCVKFNGCILKMINNECNKYNEFCDKDVGECRCKKNFKYSNDRESCEEDKCASCPKNSDCNEESDDPCQCNDGYFDGKICVKYLKCEIGFPKCQHKCNITSGECICEYGFELLDDKVTCEREDSASCNLNCYPGSCVKKEGNETCICPEATHKFVNETCIDVCTLSNGKPPEGMTCEGKGKCHKDDDRSIRCICEDPYEQAEDGIHCRRKEMCKEEKVITERDQKSALCKEDNNAKGYTFYCDDRFTFDENGVCKRKCDFRETECKNLNAFCDLNENYEAVCRCPALLTRKDENSTCTEIAKDSFTGELSFLKSKYVVKDESGRRRKRSTVLYNTVELQKDLRESVEYVYTKENLKTVNILDCQETEDLLSCKMELQLNSKPTDVNAFVSPSYCYTLENEFCLVKNLVVKRGKGNVFTQTNPCILKDTFCDEESTKCVPNFEKETFMCVCKGGFNRTRSFPVLNEGNFVDKCEDINECKSSNTHRCPVNTTCINTHGSYECECDIGFRKKDGNLDPRKHGCEDVCYPNPCLHNGNCSQKRDHGFICSCGPMYTGERCNKTVYAKANEVVDRKSAAIVGGVLGTLLVVILILFVFTYRKMKNSKIDEEDEEYAKYRQRSIMEEKNRLRNRQRKDIEDLEIDPGTDNRHSRLQRESGDHRREIHIPRVQTSRSRDTDQGRLETRSDTEISEKPTEISSARNERRRSKMQFSNRAYDEEE